MKTFLLAPALFVLSATTAFSAQNPWVGRWKPDTAKSTFVEVEDTLIISSPAKDVLRWEYPAIKFKMHVYCAHLFFVFAGLALLYGEVEQLHGLMAISLVAVTFAVLILVALNEARKRRRNREAQSRRQTDAGSIPAREAA